MCPTVLLLFERWQRWLLTCGFTDVSEWSMYQYPVRLLSDALHLSSCKMNSPADERTKLKLIYCFNSCLSLLHVHLSHLHSRWNWSQTLLSRSLRSSFSGPFFKLALFPAHYTKIKQPIRLDYNWHAPRVLETIDWTRRSVGAEPLQLRSGRGLEKLRAWMSWKM